MIAPRSLQEAKRKESLDIVKPHLFYTAKALARWVLPALSQLRASAVDLVFGLKLI